MNINFAQNATHAGVRYAAPAISPSTPHSVIRCAFGALLALLLAGTAPAALAATAATAGASSAYGLAVEATLDLPLLPDPTVAVGPLPSGVADTAPPDYNLSDSTVSATAILGTLGTIASTGVLNASASSNLAANTTNASASVDDLLVNIDPLVGPAVLNLTALTVASTAQASCTAGSVTVSGTTTLENAQATIGALASVGLEANPAPNTVVPIVGIAGLSIILNEQIVTATEITVNAIHISFLDLALTGDLLSGDIIVSQSVASLQDCTGGAAPDLSIDKTHTGNFTQGQVGAQYSITVNNIGAAPTVGTVTVTESLPAGLSATAISGTGWTCTLATLTCTRSDALPGGSSYPVITLTVNVAANATSPQDNTVNVTGGGDTSPDNNSDTDSTIIEGAPAAPDLTIEKTHTGNFTQGQVGAQYSITVGNIGGGPSSGTVTVTDLMPAGFTATAISGTGWTCTLATLTCTRSDALAAGASYPAITLTVNVAANATSPQDNTVTVSGGGDTSPGNNSDTDSTIIDGAPAAPDLTINKTHTGNFAQGQVGAQYSITVSNVGGGASAGTVTVTDALPAAFTATAISGTGWTCTLATLTCTRADALAAGASYPAINLTVDVAADATSPQGNTVNVTGGSDTTPENNTDTDSAVIDGAPAGPDLAILKTHAGNFAQGQVGAQYTITVSNVGAGPTSGTVTVTDTLPAGLTATAISGSGWTCTLGTLTCTRSDTLATGASYPAITLTVNVAANASSSVVNSVVVSGGNDSTPQNNTDTDATTVTQGGGPNLTIAKSAQGTFVLGQTGATYTLTVSNTGAGPTVGTVTVADTPPTGFAATSMTGSGWTCSTAALTCTRSDVLAAGASYPPILLVGNIASNAGSPLVNVAVVLGGGDTSTDDNSDTETTGIVGVDPTVIGGSAIAVPMLDKLGLLLMAVLVFLAGLAARGARSRMG